MEYCEKLIANSVGWKLVAQTINQAMSYISRFQTWTTHMGPEGPSNFTKKLKGSDSAIFFFFVI